MLGDRVKEARSKKNMTQRELAELLGISDGHIAHIERGARDPSIRMLGRIAKVLNVTTDWLCFGEESKSA